MNLYNSLKYKTINELAEWLNEYCSHDFSPWTNWFDRNYCKKCDSIYFNGDRNEYSWCEINGKCKYFQDMSDIPNNKQVIKMWLESDI
jgi:hypothetical protein